MSDSKQEEVVAFLRSSSLFGAEPTAIEEVTTHISRLLLGPEIALKLKRTVKRPYVDFSTPELRLQAAEREVELNRRTAPNLYRGLRRITRAPDGSLEFDGEGDLVDVVVEMRRFDEATLFDWQAVAGTLTPEMVASLAVAVAEFHQALEPVERTDGAAHMAGVLDVNESAFASNEVFDRQSVEALNAVFREQHERLSRLLDERGREGRIRRCHGDLHLRNICLVDGEATIFDCLEFDEELGTTDLLYDLAFLLMDLWHRDLRDHANLVLNRYLDVVEDEAGLPAVPFFMAVRAAVRAHVAATASSELAGEKPDEAKEKCDEAWSYFRLAQSLLSGAEPALVAVGGLSGSGKSTVARAIAASIGPAPGARNLSSDRLRKKRYGVAAETPLPADAYALEVTQAVYATLAERAKGALLHGHGVVADATFSTAAEREAIAAVAKEAGVAFHGLWLEVPAGELLRRVGARRNDPSDATSEIVLQQLGRDHGAIDWTIVEADGPIEDVREAALKAIGLGASEAADPPS